MFFLNEMDELALILDLLLVRSSIRPPARLIKLYQYIYIPKTVSVVGRFATVLFFNLFKIDKI